MTDQLPHHRCEALDPKRRISALIGDAADPDDEAMGFRAHDRTHPFEFPAPIPTAKPCTHSTVSSSAGAAGVGPASKPWRGLLDSPSPKQCCKLRQTAL